MQGQIGPATIERLTPQILRLQSTSRAPITVYIDSEGGSVFHSTTLLRLLRAPSIETRDPCRIITVVTSFAGSAAADFLAGGDYALAYPGSLIHFHGARTKKDNLITVEEASGVARDLKESNNRSAIQLAKSCQERFFFRFFSLRATFESFRREKPQNADLDDEACFLKLISKNLTSWGHRVVARASERKHRYQAVSDSVFRSKAILKALTAVDVAKPETSIKLEVELLRALVTFESVNNRKKRGWTFASKGLGQLGDDFFLFNEYMSHHGGIPGLCEFWADYLQTPEETAELGSLTGTDRTAFLFTKIVPRIFPTWLFFAALCHALQVEENPMTAMDAFWLGLIDEVIGEDLPTPRKVVESGPAARLIHSTPKRSGSA